MNTSFATTLAVHATQTETNNASKVFGSSQGIPSFEDAINHASEDSSLQQRKVARSVTEQNTNEQNLTQQTSMERRAAEQSSNEQEAARQNAVDQRNMERRSIGDGKSGKDSSSQGRSSAQQSSSKQSASQNSVTNQSNNIPIQQNNTSPKQKKSAQSTTSSSSTSSSQSESDTTVDDSTAQSSSTADKTQDATLPVYLLAGQIAVPPPLPQLQTTAQPSTTDQATSDTDLAGVTAAGAGDASQQAATAAAMITSGLAQSADDASGLATSGSKVPDGEKATDSIDTNNNDAALTDTSVGATMNHFPLGEDITKLKAITLGWAKTIQSSLNPSGTLDASSSTLMTSLPIHIDSSNGQNSNAQGTPDAMNGLSGLQMASAASTSLSGNSSFSQVTTTTIPAQSVHDVPQIVTKELNSSELTMPKRIEIPLQTPHGANVTLYLQDVQGQVRAQFSTNDHSALQWIDQQIPGLKQQQFETNVRWLPPQMDNQNSTSQQGQGQSRDPQRETNSQQQETESADAFVSAMGKVSYA